MSEKKKERKAVKPVIERMTPARAGSFRGAVAVTANLSHSYYAVLVQ